MSYCATCGRATAAGESGCQFCNTDSWWDDDSSNPRTSSEAYLGNNQHPSFNSTHKSSAFLMLPATRGMRLLGLVLDTILFTVLLGLGWLIWFGFTAARGQTPAKALLHLRVEKLDGTTSFATTVLRHFTPHIFAIITLPFTVLGLLSLPFGFGAIISLLDFAAKVVPLVDAMFIFRPDQRRIVDHIFKTRVTQLPR